MFEAFDFCNPAEFELPDENKDIVEAAMKSQDFESLVLYICETYDYYISRGLDRECKIEVYKCLQYICFLLEELLIDQTIDCLESDEDTVIGCTWNCMEKLALNTRFHIEKSREGEDQHLLFVYRDFWMIARYLHNEFNQFNRLKEK